MTQQTLDLHRALRLLRRFWRTVAIFTVIGGLLAAGYGLTRPQTYKASALVLLPDAASSAGSQTPSVNSIATDARIATSAAVLVPAGRKVDRSLSFAALGRSVAATPSPTASVLTITATGRSAKQTEGLADAVAGELVSFVASTGSQASAGAVTALQAQVTQLNGQLSSLQKEINAVNKRLDAEGSTSAAGERDSRLLTEYTSEQTDLQLQLSGLKSQIGTTEVGQVSTNQGTQVIQKATTASSSRRSALLLAVIIGLLVGALAGSVLVLSRHRRDARLFTRDELAGALGAPVALSLRCRPRRASSDWVEFFDRYEPGSAEQWSVRKVLRELEVVDGDASRLEVLMLAGDAPAAVLAALVAVSAAGSETDTVFAFADDPDSMPGLRAACQRLAQRDEPPRPELAVVSADEPPPGTAAALSIVARTIDPARPVALEPGEGTVTVVAVSAGTANADQLARVAITASDAGQPVRAILVANPDADDQTTGRFPDACGRASLVLDRRAADRVVSGRRPGPGRLSAVAGGLSSVTAEEDSVAGAAAAGRQR